MSFLSLLNPTLAKTVREAVKALPPAPKVSQNQTDAEANGYTGAHDTRPAPLAIVTMWSLDAPCSYAMSFHPRDNPQDATKGNARGEALALQISNPDRREALIKAGCKPGPSYCPSFIAPKGWASGRQDVGQPLGLWNDAGPEGERLPQRGGRRPWDAIDPPPKAGMVWTVEGWH